MTLTVAETATLVHGYTMADVERFTRIAARSTSRGKRVLSPDEVRDSAWYGVVELLYASTEPPSPSELIFAGKNAVGRSLDKTYQHYGWNRTLKDHAPAYSKYWLPVTGGNNDDGFSDRIAEKLALPKLLDELDDDQYEVVVALAAHGSQVSAARSLGLSKQTFNRRLLDARDVMAAAWFQPDTPPRKIKPGNDAYCRHGHARDEHSHRDSRGSWVCRPCSRASQRRHTAREGTYHSRHKDAGAA